MKRMVGLVVATFLANALVTQASAALSASPLPAELPASPVLVTGYQISGGAPVFVQLYNNSSNLVSLDGWQIVYEFSGEAGKATLPINLNSWLRPHQYAVISAAGAVQGADADVPLPSDLGAVAASGLQLMSPGTHAPYVVKGAFLEGIRYQLSQSAAGNYTTNSKFETVGANVPLYGGGLYTPPVEAPLQVVEILASARGCAPLDKSPDCREYVKLYNPTDTPLDLSPYRLRIGYANVSAGIANTVHLSGILEPHAYMAVAARNDGKPLEITASAGNVWLEDEYGLVAYENTVVTYKDIGTKKGFSWALAGDGIWGWSVPTPNGPNNFNVPSPVPVISTTKPCKAGWYRSTETNRCRKIPVAKTLTPCKPGQYRSTETNRCRNLATATSALKPCAANQERNPTTNRCRLIASAAKQLTPCKPGQERNPATNRCRNKPAILGDAAFAVEPVQEAGKAFAGWWALGGVGILAAGYGVWEWRRELAGLIGKIGQFVARGK